MVCVLLPSYSAAALNGNSTFKCCRLGKRLYFTWDTLPKGAHLHLFGRNVQQFRSGW